MPEGEDGGNLSWTLSRADKGVLVNDLRELREVARKRGMHPMTLQHIERLLIVVAGGQSQFEGRA